MSSDRIAGVHHDDDLVAFFLALPSAARREYEALAELDRRFGEDVEAEQRARGAADRRQEQKS